MSTTCTEAMPDTRGKSRSLRSAHSRAPYYLVYPQLLRSHKQWSTHTGEPAQRPSEDTSRRSSPHLPINCGGSSGTCTRAALCHYVLCVPLQRVVTDPLSIGRPYDVRRVWFSWGHGRSEARVAMCTACHLDEVREVRVAWEEELKKLRPRTAIMT